ncbi:unnamed protein product [Rhodiola kirilowii]
MKSMATCYNEHAIKISDSCCSIPNSQIPIPSVQNSVTCLYRSIIQNEDTNHILIRLAWTNNLIGKGFDIQIADESSSTSDQLRKSKGSKIITIQSTATSRFDIKWDLSDAEYDNGPEPTSNFYVMVFQNSKPIMLLGDYEEHNMSPRYVTFAPVSRTESFSGSAVFSTKAQFGATGTPHDIVIRYWGDKDGLREHNVTVSVDKKRVVVVKKLQWNFRGSQCIFVDGVVVDLMWDVHGWVFHPVSGLGLFLFRTRSGLESRLWLEKDNKSLKQYTMQQHDVSLLVIACRKHPD